MFRAPEVPNTPDKNVFTHAVVATLEELSEIDIDVLIFGIMEKVVVPSSVVDAFDEPMVSVPPDKLDPMVIAPFAEVEFIVRTVIVEELIDDEFDVVADTFATALLITAFTQDVVGILEELSAMAKEAFIFGFVEKVVVPSSVVEAFADPMDSVPPDKLDPIVIAPVAEVEFIVKTFIVERFINDDTFVIALFTIVFTQDVVGILEELSAIDNDEFIFGFMEKVVTPSNVAVDTFNTDVFVFMACIVVIVPEVVSKLINDPFDTFSTETFASEKVCTPLQVFESVFT